MNKEEFIKEFETYKDMALSVEQCEKFYKYMDLLIEWNEKINLTAIVEPKEIVLKHFVDSLTIFKYLKNGDKLIDVGTGAGFPGIPNKIYNENLDVTLLDSLKKRTIFLDEVINNLQLKNIRSMHGRVEEIAQNKQFREQFDVATSRAVAQLNILLEYLLPLVKVGGLCICMKGSEIDEELNNAKNALQILGGELEKIESFELPGTDMKRNLVIIRKTKNTPSKYPRKSGTPSKEPLK